MFFDFWIFFYQIIFNLRTQLANELNYEQKKAVFSIIRTESTPFLLDGPPGTGKTKTLVAAINEIVRTTKKNILVCAHSNSACDEITQRLADVLRPGELFRMFAINHNRKLVHDKIKPFCNLIEENFKFPSLRYLYMFRVVICTLLTAGAITRARRDQHFNSGHFAYTFIDEAACVPEIIALIPIAGKFFLFDSFISFPHKFLFYFLFMIN